MGVWKPFPRSNSRNANEATVNGLDDGESKVTQQRPGSLFRGVGTVENRAANRVC